MPAPSGPSAKPKSLEAGFIVTPVFDFDGVTQKNLRLQKRFQLD
jgi:hypothetical protein